MKIAQALTMLCVLVIWGCGDSKSPVQPGLGEIKMFLVDRSAGFDAVNIEVVEVSVHQAGVDSVSGWTVIDNTVRTFDLLTLTNGASAILGNSKLNPGHYTQIRLKLGTGSSVVVGGASYPLDVPSGTQTGLKLTHEFDIVANTLYELTIDFDAARSIHTTGKNYKLSPTLRVTANVISGTISGTVNPIASKALVSTVVGIDTVSTMADTMSGIFKLMALPEGLYNLHIASSATGYQDTVLTGVTVVARQNTDIGAIVLHP